jgi:hypothetical protein
MLVLAIREVQIYMRSLLRAVLAGCQIKAQDHPIRKYELRSPLRCGNHPRSAASSAFEPRYNTRETRESRYHSNPYRAENGAFLKPGGSIDPKAARLPPP